jgi:hypothetical protein
LEYIPSDSYIQHFSSLISINAQSSSPLNKNRFKALCGRSKNLAVSRHRPGPREIHIGCQLERKIEIAVFFQREVRIPRLHLWCGPKYRFDQYLAATSMRFDAFFKILPYCHYATKALSQTK